MCFSAAASFSLGAVLFACGAVIHLFWQGVLSVQGPPKERTKVVFQHGPRVRLPWQWLPVTLLPVLFGVQQVCEGVVWVRINAGANPSAAAHAFLAFALPIWPVYIPFMLLCLKAAPSPNTVRVADSNGRLEAVDMGAPATIAARRPRAEWALLVALQCVGVCVACLLVLLMLEGFNTEVDGDHVYYDLQWSTLADDIRIGPAPILSGYVAATCLSWALVHHFWVKVLGLAVVVGFLLSLLLVEQWLISTWCFFAAASSVLVLVAVVTEQRQRKVGASPV